MTQQEALLKHEAKELDLNHEQPVWAGVEANWTRFMNDDVLNSRSNNLSCTTYVRFGRGLVFYAKQQIPAGSELTWSYGTQFWRSRQHMIQKPLSEGSSSQLAKSRKRSAADSPVKRGAV